VISNPIVSPVVGAVELFLEVGLGLLGLGQILQRITELLLRRRGVGVSHHQRHRHAERAATHG
jgi:hypothetical protein